MNSSPNNQPRSQVRASLLPATEQAAENLSEAGTGAKTIRRPVAAANLKILVSALHQGPLAKDQICALLKNSESGTRKYLKELWMANILIVDTSVVPTVYALSKAETHVKSFLNTLQEKRSLPRRRTNVNKAQLDPSRRIHLMHDDVHYKVRVRTAVASRDPLGLSPEFFHPKPDDGEPLPRTAPTPRTTPYFPAPSEHRFVLEVAA